MWRRLEHHAYLMALVGLALFYGLERIAVTSRADRRERGGRDQTGRAVFWIHVAAFALYNVLIGYALVDRDKPGLRNLLLYSCAMAFHFAVNDAGLRQHHKSDYDCAGRWILAAAIAGCAPRSFA